jgi:hypothetical protein
MLRSGLRTAILLSGNALYAAGLAATGRIADATGAMLLCPYPLTRQQLGVGTPTVDRVAYVLEQAVEQLKEFRQLILVGTRAPVAYFAYPRKSSEFTSPECHTHTLTKSGEDYVGALEALETALEPSHFQSRQIAYIKPSPCTGAIVPLHHIGSANPCFPSFSFRYQLAIRSVARSDHRFLVEIILTEIRVTAERSANKDGIPRLSFPPLVHTCSQTRWGRNICA